MPDADAPDGAAQTPGPDASTDDGAVADFEPAFGAGAGATSRGLDRAGRRRVTAVLCLTEITSWGTLFYAFPVLQRDIASDTGWASVPLAGAFTAGQVVAALVGIPVGRLLDRHGPRWLMTAGSVLGVAALLAVAYAPTLGWFLAAWLLAGVAMGAVLYPPAFTAVTRWHDHRDRLRALTVLTVFAGLASTVFGPLTAALAGVLDWRDTYLVLAVVLAVVTIPLHAVGLRGPWPGAAPGPSPRSGVPPTSAGPIVEAGAPRLWVTAVVFALASLAAYAVVIILVPLLLERGASLTVAGVLLGLGGLGQVAGRLGYLSLSRRTTLGSRTAITLAAMAATTALLGLLTSIALLTAVVVLAGMARGMFTLLQATAVTDRWGTRHYGRLTGLLTAPTTLAIASAPWFGAWLADRLGSYAGAFLVLAVLGAIASALVPTTLNRVARG